ncbi:hypothetical protein K458DRAFT_420058 [Lentithecium fluviatile CBS 122367]|uniref:Uncharacterized protein n=1 Tax=Lentithecium fluviatile CBS 122367 TaxID=1168545 RepID=A0A6G1IW58_9PLEO|nr:hypothetical protein K458DRAFT_420058 [Lentithecium fluviatile CBS 122367]
MSGYMHGSTYDVDQLQSRTHNPPLADPHDSRSPSSHVPAPYHAGLRESKQIAHTIKPPRPTPRL